MEERGGELSEGNEVGFDEERVELMAERGKVVANGGGAEEGAEVGDISRETHCWR